MKTITIGSRTVEIYDSIDEMPMSRFHKYNKMILIDGGIGSDLTDVDGHIEKAIAYSKSSTPELAAIELDNLRQNLYMIQSNLSPKHMAFAVLVKSIDGIEKMDLSPEGLQKVLDYFSEIPQNDITAHSEAVKKKIDEELQVYFPAIFDDASIKEFYDSLRKRTLLMLTSIIEGTNEEIEKEIDQITLDLITYNKPHVFTGNKNAEIQHDKNFDNMCLLISQHLHVDPKSKTILEFYNSFEYVKDLLKQKKSN